jgi:ribosomal protein S27AE
MKRDRAIIEAELNATCNLIYKLKCLQEDLIEEIDDLGCPRCGNQMLRNHDNSRCGTDNDYGCGYVRWD